MGRNVQIRNVDDATYEVLRRRAAENDLSLTQYLRRELNRLAEPQQQTMAEWLDRADDLRRRHGGVNGEVLAEALEEARAERDARFDDL
jgi:plasmid stability protein